jgi:acyl-CoA thioester hydrolase
MTRSFALTVRYAETDAQGIVHHSRYLVWFEEGRSDFLRQQGLHYRDFETAGYFIVVAAAEVQYKAPACYEDVVTIETTLEKMRGKFIEFSYRALNAAGALLAVAAPDTSCSAPTGGRRRCRRNCSRRSVVVPWKRREQDRHRGAAGGQFPVDSRGASCYKSTPASEKGRIAQRESTAFTRQGS